MPRSEHSAIKDFAGSHRQKHVIGVTDGAGQPAVQYPIGLTASLALVSRILQVFAPVPVTFFQALR